MADMQNTPKPDIMDAVRKFRGNAEQSDDITMLALRYLQPGAKE